MIGLIVRLCIALLPSVVWAQDRVVTVSGLPVWDSAPLLQLVETQPLTDQGIRFQFQPWRAPEELGAMFVRGEVHIANMPSMLAPIFAKRGLDLALLGTSAPKGNIAIVYRQEHGEIALPFKGGMPDLILRSLAKQNLTPRYTATPVEAMQLLLSGQVSGAFLAQPFVTISTAKSEGRLKSVDACTIWQKAHDIDHCPATGVFVASDLTNSEQQAIAAVLASAYAQLSIQPERAADLLKTQFPMLRDAPLTLAFSGLTPQFQPMCETSWISQTLRILEPHGPHFQEDALSWAKC